MVPDEFPLLDYAPPRPRSHAGWVGGLVAVLVVVAVGWAAYRWVPRRVPKPPPRTWGSVEQMHAYFVERFVAGDGFGFGRMASVSDISWDHTLVVEGRGFKVDEVELVSVDPAAPGRARTNLTWPQPFVYTEPFTVRKDELQTSHKRPLNDDVAAAARRLAAGVGVVFEPGARPPVLVGAIRATGECVGCHRARAGTLLGAFSYRLVAVK
jgi:hypothetical protein